MPAIAELSNAHLENLWWAMHHSYIPTLMSRTLALTAYWDDSGSDDLSTATTIGGPIMCKDAFMEFSAKWHKMLTSNRIAKPLHMSDFIGMGRYASIPKEFKRALFLEAVDLINSHKLYSISVSVLGADYNSTLTAEVRKNLIGPYGMCFFTAALGTHEFSAKTKFFTGEITAYLVDTGFAFSDQLVKAHASIIDVYKSKDKPCYCGSLTFSPDDNVPALQAADVISWIARKVKLGDLPEGFEPLKDVMATERTGPESKDWMFHTHIDLPKSAVEMFATPINNWLSLGQLPSIRQILR